MTAIEQLRALARYKTHGGYVWAAVTADGELLCVPCVRENYRLVYGCTRTWACFGMHEDIQWECVGIANSGESEETEYCAHCNKIIWEHDE